MHAMGDATLTFVIDKTQWSKFIDATSDGAYNAAIAERLGVDPATVGRWRTGAVDPKPRQVVAYARAFGQSPIQALIAAGYLTPEEADLPATPPRHYALDDFTSLELAEELVSRLASADGYSVTTLRGEPSIVRIDGGKIVRVGDVGTTEEDLREVAAETITEHPEDTDDQY